MVTRSPAGPPSASRLGPTGEPESERPGTWRGSWHTCPPQLGELISLLETGSPGPGEGATAPSAAVTTKTFLEHLLRAGTEPGSNYKDGSEVVLVPGKSPARYGRWLSGKLGDRKWS